MGFNIVGGVDQQYVYNDSGVYVSKIKEDGAAGQDGRLQEGDKILSVIKASCFCFGLKKTHLKRYHAFTMAFSLNSSLIENETKYMLQNGLEVSFYLFINFNISR